MVTPVRWPAMLQLVASTNRQVYYTPRAFSLVKRLGLRKLPASNQHVVLLLDLASTVRGLS
jgi:hypothetical protein